MMFINEFIRQFREMRQFKLNLLFANLSIFLIIFSYIKYFEERIDTFTVYALLFCWYFATHSITHPTYFIEDEVFDRTLISIIQSKSSIFKILIDKIFVQILLDTIKAIPLFFLLAIFIKLDINDWLKFAFTLMAIILAIISLYGVGTLISGFTLIFRRTSSISSLISYGLIFFAGILDSNISNHIMHYILPFDQIKLFINTGALIFIFNIFCYGLIYWISGIFLFNILLNIAKKKGTLFNV